MEKNTFKYNIDQGLYDGVFAVPTKIVDQYLKLASGASLKVVFYLLRNSGIDIDIDSICLDTGLSLPQIKDSFLFWEQVGVLKKGQSDFVLENRVYQTPNEKNNTEENNIPKEKNLPPAVLVKSRSTSAKNEEIVVESPTPKVVRITNSPKYPTQKEAAQRLRESEDIKFLVKKTEEALERPLNSSALASLVMLIDWAEIPSDIIIMVVHYCKSIDIRDIRRIEKTALEFKDMGIDTHKKADEYINSKSKHNSFERSVKKILGIGGRNLSRKEGDQIGLWYQKYNFSLELVEEAFSRCVDNINEISLPYMNTILTNWHEKGLKNSQEILDFEKDYLSKNSNQNSKKTKNKKASVTYDLKDVENTDMHRVPKL